MGRGKNIIAVCLRTEPAVSHLQRQGWTEEGTWHVVSLLILWQIKNNKKHSEKCKPSRRQLTLWTGFTFEGTVLHFVYIHFVVFVL